MLISWFMTLLKATRTIQHTCIVVDTGETRGNENLSSFKGFYCMYYRDNNVELIFIDKYPYVHLYFIQYIYIINTIIHDGILNICVLASLYN